MSHAPVLIVRPEPGLAATLAAAGALGLRAIGQPLFVAEPLPWQCPPADGFDGLVVASANAVRLAGPQLGRMTGLPVHAVGQATADAARQAGLRVASVGEADLAALIAALPRPTRLLRLAGEEHVALAPEPRLGIETRIVYTMRPLPLPPSVAATLNRESLVLLHSAAAARHFAGECDRLGAARRHIALACLAPRVAAAAGTGWRSVTSAPRPDDRALLALARQLCQTGGSEDR